MDNQKEEQIKRISSIMDKTQFLYEKWAKSRKISYPMLVVLYALYLEGTVKQRDLVEKRSIPKQTIRTIMLELENKEYVTITIDEQNKRSKNVFLTESGKKYAEEIIKPLLNCEKEVFNKMGNENIKILIEKNEQYATLLEEKMKNYDSYSKNSKIKNI